MISIITINFNNAIGLENTIKSVITQTDANFEHIIIDGNSTDSSKEIIEKYSNGFSYWISEPDTGVYNAMNKGIRAAKGDYLLFLNSGDTLYNDTILDSVSKSISQKFDIYYGDLIFFNDKSKMAYNYPEKLSFSFLYEKSLAHPATFIKKTLFDTVFMYNENLRITSDWEFFICAICKFNASYKHLDFIISNFEEGGLSSTPENIKIVLEERNVSLRINFPLFIDDNEKLVELVKSNSILKTNRFKMLLELEKSSVAKKINSLVLRILLKIFKGKTLKDL